MKRLFFALITTFVSSAFAQNITPAAQLPAAILPGNSTLHFVSPEPIQYVDISTKQLEGDLPLPNVCRIHLRDSVRGFEHAVITLAGETFMAQYQILPGRSGAAARIEIVPSDTRPLDIASVGLTTSQLKTFAQQLFCARIKAPVVKVKALGLTGCINQVFTVNDYIFLDVSFLNNTGIKYTTGDINWTLEDRKITKATNVQSLDIKPLIHLFPIKSFKRSYRNVFVLPKILFPGSKVLRLTMREKQVSGRVISIDLSYRDVLDADIMPPR